MGPGHVDVLELIRREPRAALYLRDDLVASSGDVETVDEVTAQHGRQIATDLFQGQPHRGDLVPVEDDLARRLVDPYVGYRRKGKLSALRGIGHDLIGDVEQGLMIERGRDHEFHREESGARQGRGQEYRRPDPRHVRGFLGQVCLNGKDVAAPLAPGFHQGAAEASGRERDLEALGELGHGREHPLHLLGIGSQLLEGRVRRYVDGSVDDALILVRRKLLGRQQIQRYRA